VMRLRFYVGTMVALVAAAFLVDQLLGKLYVRYMILFSGAVFLWGMLVGQRSEQAWMRRRMERGAGAHSRVQRGPSNQEVGR
jgi:hypothetical protein